MYVVDIHCHILPGVDDGSRDEAMSMDMLGIAYSQGIRKLILTPHYYPGKTGKKGEDFKCIFEDLKKKAADIYPGLALYLGNEIFWSEGAVEALKSGVINTMAGTRYVLVEFSPATSYGIIYNAIRELIMARFRPIIAHVERYSCVTRHIDKINELIENGAYLQMNADSLVGGVMDRHVRWCRKLVQEGYISFLGTDAHNTDDRAPYIEQTLSWLETKLSIEQQEALLFKNGEKLINGEWI